MSVINRMYYCYLKFLEKTTLKKEASEWAIMFLCGFLASNLMMILYVVHLYIDYSNVNKLIVGVLFLGAYVLMCWYYIAEGRVDSIVSRYSKDSSRDFCALYGLLFFVESLILPFIVVGILIIIK